MRLFENLERIKRMNRLIKCGHTGTPAEFASTIGISQSHLFRCLHELQQYGLDIRYSRSMQTYFYGHNHELSVSYSVKIIEASEAKEINGGVRRVIKYRLELNPAKGGGITSL